MMEWPRIIVFCKQFLGEIFPARWVLGEEVILNEPSDLSPLQFYVTTFKIKNALNQTQLFS